MSLPERLRQSATDALPWDRARATTLPEFLARYDLHDSQWIRIETSPDGSAVALFEWDTFWAGGRLPHDSSWLADWPVLALAFDAVYEVRLAWDADPTLTVGDAESRPVGPEERERMFDRAEGPGAGALSAAALDGSLHHTTVHDVGRGRVDLLHGAAVRVLCIDRDGRPVDLPWDLPGPPTQGPS